MPLKKQWCRDCQCMFVAMKKEEDRVKCFHEKISQSVYVLDFT